MVNEEVRKYEVALGANLISKIWTEILHPLAGSYLKHLV